MDPEKKKSSVITFHIAMDYDNMFNGAQKLQNLRDFIHELNNFMRRMEECGVAIPEDIVERYKKRYSHEFQNVSFSIQDA